MNSKIFDPKHLKKLNNPERLKEIPPNIIWQRLNLYNPQIAVDIGAGTGFFAKKFLEFMPGGKIYACDISDIMLDWMKENVCPEHSQIIPIKMAHDTFPCEKNMADLVYMINLHHEIEDHGSILKEIFQTLKPGGKMFIIDWKKEITEQGPPAHIKFEIEEVKTQLEKAGFQRLQLFNDFPKHFMVIAEK